MFGVGILPGTFKQPPCYKRASSSGNVIYDVDPREKLGDSIIT